jgi:hypothetical protein
MDLYWINNLKNNVMENSKPILIEINKTNLFQNGSHTL